MTTTLQVCLLSAAALVLCGYCPTAAAQQNSPPDTKPIPECNDYLLKNDPVLSLKQRTCIWSNNLVTPGAIFGAAFSSAYGQLTGDEPSWGQGSAGYFKRFGARYAQGAAKATGQYLTAAAFQEDPRRVASTCISWKRALCAARSIILQRDSNGGNRFLVSNLAGAAANGFVGMAFYPDSGTVKQSLRRTGTSLASTLLSVELTEFQPDILRWVGKKFSPKSTALQAGNPHP